jgi:hypothetical protein
MGRLAVTLTITLTITITISRTSLHSSGQLLP